MDNKRIGVIVPSSNSVVEVDFARALPPSHTFHTARMYLADTTSAGERIMLEKHAPQAAIDLGTLFPEVVVFACTSAGALLGIDGEAELERKLAQLSGAGVVSTNAAVAESLRAVDATRVAVVTAYNEELTRAIADTLQGRGFDVASAQGMDITDNVAIADVTPEEIVEFVADHVRFSNVDALFVSCTNLHAVEAVPQLRKLSGLPVITSNLATIAVTLQRIGVAQLEETLR